MRSTDPLFRPVSVHNAPDGTLYLADMYTGIIQDAQFVGPDSYLRRKIEQYQLDKQHNWGRIWRITHEGTPPDRTMPRMYSETPAQLVRHLEHANGWWRDTAQRLLVLRQDKSVVPALRTMAQSSPNQLARIHAMWTLEGLGALDAGAGARVDEEPGPADPHPGHSRERDAVQGRRQDVRRRLPRDGEGCRPQRRHPGDADAEPAQGAATRRR